MVAYISQNWREASFLQVVFLKFNREFIFFTLPTASIDYFKEIILVLLVFSFLLNVFTFRFLTFLVLCCMFTWIFGIFVIILIEMNKYKPRGGRHQ